MKNKYINILIYVSIAFLFIYFYKLDYFAFQDVNFNLIPLIISICLLWNGYVISSLSWWNSLKIHNVNIPIKSAIISHGLAIFAKYIPGKIWVILGRASKVAAETKDPVSELSVVSLKEQLTYLLVGILISIVPVYQLYSFSMIFMVVLLSGLGLGLAIFNKAMHNLLLWLLSKLMKNSSGLPLITIKNGFKLSLYHLFLWTSWTLGFYFFGLAIEDSFSLNLAFVFPISVVYGVLAIFMPGGIGVREGIITAYLIMSGVELEVATTISVLSRLWFVLGEIFIFLLALVLNFREDSKN
ncbi:MAG: flippase-like domain-containing protein [Bacteroidales bacterium]|nr:flippase-like domain-containing protein [Bacteroidales bacterium]